GGNERGGPKAAPLQHVRRRAVESLPLLLAGLSAGGAQDLTAVEGRGLGRGPLARLAAGHEVEALLARLALVERGVELRQDESWCVRDVAERHELPGDVPDDREARRPGTDVGLDVDRCRAAAEERDVPPDGAVVHLDRTLTRDALRAGGLSLGGELALDRAQRTDRDVAVHELHVR